MIRTDLATVRPAARLRGELRLPGDKSISHRALLFATLAAGESRILGAGDGADVRSTAGIMRALGARVEPDGEAEGAAERGGAPGRGRNVGYRVDRQARTASRNPPPRWTAATPARACDSSPGCSPGCP